MNSRQTFSCSTKRLKHSVKWSVKQLRKQGFNNQFHKGFKKGQSGFALLTVLMVVAIVSILTAQMFSSQHSQIERSGVMLHQAQALSVQWGLEDWVKSGLKLDIENNKTDHLQELWAQPLPPVSFEEGTVGGLMIDAQSKLNLNNVLVKDAAQKKLWQGIFNRYWQLGGDRQAWADNLAALMLQGVATGLQNPVGKNGENSEDSANEQRGLETVSTSMQTVEPWPGFAEVVTDWVDADNDPLPLGAESDQYQLQEPSFSAANQPLVSVAELYNFPTFSSLDWQAQQIMSAGLTSLPKITPVNINTATSIVLQSLAQWMSAEIVSIWIEQRTQQPAETVDEFMTFLQNQTGFSAQEIQKDLPAGFLSVSSEFFQLTSVLDYGRARNTLMYAVFYRSANEVKLVQRWIGFANE